MPDLGHHYAEVGQNGAKVTFSSPVSPGALRATVLHTGTKHIPPIPSASLTGSSASNSVYLELYRDQNEIKMTLFGVHNYKIHGLPFLRVRTWNDCRLP